MPVGLRLLKLWQTPERLVPFVFLLLAMVLGSSYALVMPPYQVPDETWHLYRAYGISLGSCVGGQTTPVPNAFIDFKSVHDLSPAQITRGGTSPSIADTAAQEPISASAPTTNVDLPTANLYTCVPYALTAFELAAAREFHLTVAHAFYLGRLVNLTAYTALVFCALLILPGLQVSMMCLALMPMTLHQAASFSADALTISSAFLLVAYCFHLAFSSTNRLRPAELAILCLLTVFSSLCKTSLSLPFLVLLIPAQRFGRPARRWLTLAALVVLPGVAAVSWQLLNEKNLELFKQFRMANTDVDVQENARFLLHEPVAFLEAFERTVVA
jgi:hypothetical protein